MKNRKNKFKTVVAFGLAISMLAGCGKVSTTEESKSQGAASSEVITETSASQAEESAYPEYLNLDSARPIVKDGEEITLRIVTKRPGGGLVTTDINDSWFVQFIEQKLNINLEIEELTDENLAERKNLILASDEMPDMMFACSINQSDILKYGVEGGQFLAISDYVNEELTPNIVKHLAEDEEATKASTAPDGKLYVIPYLQEIENGKLLGNPRMFYDTDYMEAAGITEAPKTWDEYLAMLRAFKALDPAVMGVDEIWPVVGRSESDKYMIMHALGWVANPYNVAEPGKDMELKKVIVPCLEEEKYTEYVKMLNTMYTEGLIHPDYYTMDGMAKNALISEGKVPVNTDWAHYLNDPEGWKNYIAASPVTSEWCSTPVCATNTGFDLGHVVVSADTEYPEVCMRLLDYLLSAEGIAYGSYGAPAGSEDTLGLIEGYYYEDGVLTIPEVVSGEYADNYTFQNNKIIFFSGGALSVRNRSLQMQEVAGIENPQVSIEYNLDDPDDHYRAIVKEAQSPYVVSVLPTPFMSSDETIAFNDLKSSLKNYANAETAKFVVGQRPLSELSDFFEELKAMGADEYLAMVNEIYKDVTIE